MDEKKTYPVVGTVTISTEEYRDLITGLAEAKMDAEKKNSRWCDEYNRARKLECELKELTEKYEQVTIARNRLSMFVSSDSERLKAYTLFSAGIGDEANA